MVRSSSGSFSRFAILCSLLARALGRGGVSPGAINIAHAYSDNQFCVGVLHVIQIPKMHTILARKIDIIIIPIKTHRDAGSLQLGKQR